METITKNYKLIDCPIHPGKHSAILYQDGHNWAGIWECIPTGATDGCDHENIHVEEFTVDTMRNGEHDQYERPGYVCDDCLTTVEGDPVADNQPDREE